MRYSFVIPTYNNKVLLKNTLEALNYQPGYGFYEVVVVDDGSSDNTYDFIKGVNRNYELKYFYLERCSESCRARTRNYGWKNASGDIIAFIDSDIIARPDYLFELNRCFSVDENILVIGNRLLLNNPTTYNDIISTDIFKKYYFDPDNLEILEFRSLLYETTSYNINAIRYSWMQVYSCNLAIPKKWLEKVGGFDENFKGWGIEDIELGYSLYKEGIQIVINSKLEVLHQYHGTRNDLIIRKENIPRYDKNIEYFINKHPNALNKSKEASYKFLKGEATDDESYTDTNIRYIGIDFKIKKQLNDFKKMLLRALEKKNTIIVINDYVEDTDLDIWLQIHKQNGKIEARYYPMSKKLDKVKIDEYLKKEKERQEKEDNQVKN